MKKLKIFGIWKEDNTSSFTLQKDKLFIKRFKIIISILMGSGAGIYDFEDHRGKEYTVDQLTDTISHINDKNYDFELVFFKKEIVIVLRASPKNRDKFIKKLMESYKFVELKRHKSYPFNKGKLKAKR